MATLHDFKPTMHNDISIEDELVYKQHTNLILNHNYGAATALLSVNEQTGGCRAALLNSWENKLLQLETLLTQTAFQDPYEYSQTMPDAASMTEADKIIWQQNY